MKLDVYNEAAYERPDNAHDEATLAAKLDARDEAAYERLTITHGEVTLERN